MLMEAEPSTTAYNVIRAQARADMGLIVSNESWDGRRMRRSRQVVKTSSVVVVGA
jgi:hypothetical protein